MEIRQARSDEEALLYLEVHAQVNPGTGTLEGFRHRERTWNAVNLVALLDDEPVGSGWTGPRQQRRTLGRVRRSLVVARTGSWNGALPRDLGRGAFA